MKIFILFACTANIIIYGFAPPGSDPCNPCECTGVAENRTLITCASAESPVNLYEKNITFLISTAFDDENNANIQLYNL